MYDMSVSVWAKLLLGLTSSSGIRAAQPLFGVQHDTAPFAHLVRDLVGHPVDHIEFRASVVVVALCAMDLMTITRLFR